MIDTDMIVGMVGLWWAYGVGMVLGLIIGFPLGWMTSRVRKKNNSDRIAAYNMAIRGGVLSPHEVREMEDIPEARA